MAILLTRVVAAIQVFHAMRTNGRYLDDVFTRLCPMEVRRIAWQNDGAAGRIRPY